MMTDHDNVGQSTTDDQRRRPCQPPNAHPPRRRCRRHAPPRCSIVGQFEQREPASIGGDGPRLRRRGQVSAHVEQWHRVRCERRHYRHRPVHREHRAADTTGSLVTTRPIRHSRRDVHGRRHAADAALLDAAEHLVHRRRHAVQFEGDGELSSSTTSLRDVVVVNRGTLMTT